MSESVWDCPDCGNLVPTWGFVRCPHCGTTLESGPLRDSAGKPMRPRTEVNVNGRWVVPCEACGEPIPTGSERCDRCGHRQSSYGLKRKRPPSTAVTPPTRELSYRTGTGCATTLVAMLLLLLAACTKTAGPLSTIPTEPPGGALIAFRSHVVAVELAVNQQEWEQGLMGRKHMDENAGMLFLFPSPSASDFYMYKTLIPLSVAFLQRTRGETYRVVRIMDMTPCRSSDPKACQLYDPKTSYDAALEVNAGWFVRNGVHVGSTGRVGRAPTPT